MTSPYEEEEERKEASRVRKGAGRRGPKSILRPSALKRHEDGELSRDILAGITKAVLVNRKHMPLCSR